jgi:O-antigen/teichoic acid export membrane protein
MHKQNIQKKFIIILIFFLTFPEISYAYIDPGTGSIILQGFLAFIAFIVAFSKKLKNKIKKFFNKKVKK